LAAAWPEEAQVAAAWWVVASLAVDQGAVRAAARHRRLQVGRVAVEWREEVRAVVASLVARRETRPAAACRSRLGSQAAHNRPLERPETCRRPVHPESLAAVEDSQVVEGRSESKMPMKGPSQTTESSLKQRLKSS